MMKRLTIIWCAFMAGLLGACTSNSKEEEQLRETDAITFQVLEKDVRLAEALVRNFKKDLKYFEEQKNAPPQGSSEFDSFLHVGMFETLISASRSFLKQSEKELLSAESRYDSLDAISNAP